LSEHRWDRTFNALPQFISARLANQPVARYDILAEQRGQSKSKLERKVTLT
jgi:hypothetical protein